MKKLFLLLVLAFPLAAHAQVPVFMRTARLTAARSADPAAGWNMQSLGITSYMMVWTTDGTVSAGACLFQSSVNNSFSSPSTVIAAQTVTSPGNYTTPTSGSINYGRVSCSTPIVGSGAVAVTIIGFGPEAGGGTVGIECDGDPCATEETLDRVADAVESASPVAVLPWTGTVWQGKTGQMTATTSTQVKAAVASNYLYVKHCSITNDDTDTSTNITLQAGDGGTALTVPLSAPFGYGGREVKFEPHLQVPISTALFAVNTVTGSSTYIGCEGYYTTVNYN
jgi:hypothetical protein